MDDHLVTSIAMRVSTLATDTLRYRTTRIHAESIFHTPLQTDMVKSLERVFKPYVRTR